MLFTSFFGKFRGALGAFARMTMANPRKNPRKVTTPGMPHQEHRGSQQDKIEEWFISLLEKVYVL
jgi:hypothetical protein